MSRHKWGGGLFSLTLTREIQPGRSLNGWFPPLPQIQLRPPPKFPLTPTPQCSQFLLPPQIQFPPVPTDPHSPALPVPPQFPLPSDPSAPNSHCPPQIQFPPIPTAPPRPNPVTPVPSTTGPTGWGCGFPIDPSAPPPFHDSIPPFSLFSFIFPTQISLFPKCILGKFISPPPLLPPSHNKWGSLGGGRNPSWWWWSRKSHCLPMHFLIQGTARQTLE